MRTVSAPIIETEADLTLALARLNAIFDAAKGTTESDEAEALSIMIEAYERRTIQTGTTDPIGAIRFAMEQRGYGYADLVKVIGSAARASDILNGRRSLTLPMIRRLHKHFLIPLESLISDVPPTPMPRQKPGRKPALAVGERKGKTYDSGPRP
jgi:HTH-type transcriptional regulator/antitoxin HigA